MLENLLKNQDITFSTADNIREKLIRACEKNSDIAEYRELGTSEEGRTIDAVVIGRGDIVVSLIAGAHSDEPVGPETLRTFIIEGLRQRERLAELFEKFRFVIVPHINPDGEARNQPWIRRWPDVSAYIQHAFREPPGRDLEFGYPDMRVENRLVSSFLNEHAPFSLHLSLHGMGFAEGAMLLIERHWIDETVELRFHFAEYARKLGLRLHDHDRGGEKGFIYIAPGFTTTPEGRAMQAHFRAQGDAETADKFHLSSMEFIRSLGGDPLSLVTELPLFNIPREIDATYTGLPEKYLLFKKKLPALKLQLAKGKSIDATLAEFNIQPLGLAAAIRFQLYVIELGLPAVG